MLHHVSVLYSFLLLNNIPFYGHTTLCLSVHQMMEIWVRAIINNGDTNIQMFVYTYVFISLQEIIMKRIAGSFPLIQGVQITWCVYHFEEMPDCFPKWLYHSVFSSAIYKVPFSPYPHQHIIFFVKGYLTVVLIYTSLLFLPGESQGQQSLVGCHLWGRTELDTDRVGSDLAAAAAIANDDEHLISCYWSLVYILLRNVYLDLWLIKMFS